MTTPRDSLNVLAPATTKRKFDYLHREVQDAAGRRVNRREALGLAGLALLATACGTSTAQSTGSAPAAGQTPSLSTRALENHLEIFNWSQYDDPSTYKKFKALAPEVKANLSVHETYYSSNDELLAKLNAGAGSYDIIVPSQNAVAQLIQEGKLLKLDKSLLPNLKNLDQSLDPKTGRKKYLEPSYDPTGSYHVIKDFGITMFFYNHNVVTEKPQTMLDFYHLLPKYVHKGRTNILDGAEEVVPIALMALGIEPNTDKSGDFSTVSKFLLSIRPGVTTIDSSGYINDAIAGKIILSQGWNGDVRRILAGRKSHNDLTAIIPHQQSEIWADNWCIPSNAPHPVAAHAWINWLLTPSTAVTEMNYHNYPIPIPSAVAQLPGSLRTDRMFYVDPSYTNNYHYILNVNPQVVQQRTQIYTAFKAA